MKLKDVSSWKKSNDKPRQCIKKQRHYFASIVKAMVFLVVMYGCESRKIKLKRLTAKQLMPLKCGVGEDS